MINNLNLKKIFLILLYIHFATPSFEQIQSAKEDTNGDSTILVWPCGVPIPENCKEMGNIIINGNECPAGCTFQSALNLAKNKAKDLRGDVLRLNAIKDSKTENSCDELDATVYLSSSLIHTGKIINRINDSVKKVRFGNDSTYAIVYIYRPGKFAGSALKLNMYVNDSLLCKVKNNSMFEIKIKKEGKTTFSVEKQFYVASLELPVKFGHVYYIRCGVKFGPKTTMELVDNRLGEFEYNSMQKH